MMMFTVVGRMGRDRHGGERGELLSGKRLSLSLSV